MHLVEVYATHAGLQIDKPILVEEFVPLPTDSFITFHNGGGDGKFPSKMYDYWEQVIYILKAAGLKEKIIQIGSKDEALVGGVDIDKRGETKIRQVFYILKQAKLHVGNCSFPNHSAGAADTPIVSVYGPTTVANHGPYWKNEKSILIESDRGGKKPSFSSFEPDKTINLIKPETVANAILSILGYPSSTLKTVQMGKLVHTSIIEYLPDFPLAPEMFGGAIPNCRLDYHFDEGNVFNLLAQRKCSIVTNKELNLGAIQQLKPNIQMISFEVTNESKMEYLNQLKRIGAPLRFYSRLKDKELSDLRLKYLEAGSIQQIVENETKVEEAAFFRTNKILLAGGKTWATYGHYLEKIPLDIIGKPVKVIDHPLAWRDQDFHWYFNE